MPREPAWIFRRASAGSRSPKSYATSSGPKQRSHTYLASRGYVDSHSLQISASGAIRSSLAFVPSLSFTYEKTSAGL